MSREAHGVHRWYRDVVRFSDNPVQLLTDRLINVSDPHEKDDVILYLISELRAAEKGEEVERLLLERIAERQAETRPLLSLATQYRYFEPNPVKFESTIRSAISAAETSGKFLREALGVKARGGIAFERIDLLNEAVGDIVMLGRTPGAIDIGLERDFIDRAPPGSLASSLREGFERLWASRSRTEPGP